MAQEWRGSGLDQRAFLAQFEAAGVALTNRGLCPPAEAIARQSGAASESGWG